MKKLGILAQLLVVLLLVGCSKNEEAASVDNVQKEVIAQILTSGQGALMDNSMTVKGMETVKGLINAHKVAAGQTYSVPVTQTIPDSKGIGNVTLSGTMVITVNTDQSMAYSMTLKETFTNFNFVADGKTYKANGNINYTAKMNLSGTTGYNGSLTLAGNLAVTGDNYNQTISMDLASTFSSSQKYYTLSGTINGVKINYTMNMAE